jgi:hypothetical protein
MSGRSKFSPQGNLRALLNSIAFALAALLAATPLAMADTVTNGCMEEVAQFGLNCTANDVQLAGVATRPDGSPDLTILDDGCAFPGDTVTFEATFEVLLTAQQRHDIGIFFAIDGDQNMDGAITGTCSISTVDFAPDPPWLDLDGTNDGGFCANDASRFCEVDRDCKSVGGACVLEQDLCGDIDNTVAHNPLFPTITITTACIDPDGDRLLNLPNCTSWRQPGANELCLSPLDAFPGAPSKCRCDLGFEIPIEVPAAPVTVMKTANPETVAEPGGVVQFTVELSNDSPFATLTVDTLVDDVHGNLNGQGTCSVPQVLGPGVSYSCSFSAQVSGTGGDFETDTVTAMGEDENGNDVEGSDDATVTITDVLPSITLDKTATPDEVLEPGDDVVFSVLVTNTSVSSDPVTIDSLTDDIHGDLNGQGDCSVPQVLAGAGGSYSCSFTAFVGGNSGDSELDTATATGTDDNGNPVQASDSANVLVLDTPSMIDMTKTADPTVLDEPGGDVTFTFVVNNNSAVDTVTIDSLTDTVFGDLDGQGDCSVPQVIVAGGSYSCSFTIFVAGNAFDVHTNKVTAMGTDDDGQDVMAMDDETLNFNDVPPAASLTKEAVMVVATFDVTVTNDSDAESLSLDSLSDDQFGDITQIAGDIVSTSCSVPQTIAVGGSYSCSFDAVISTSPHTDTVTGTVTDDDDNQVQPSDSATVTFE